MHGEDGQEGGRGGAHLVAQDAAGRHHAGCSFHAGTLPGEIEAVAAVMAGPAGLTPGGTGAAAASHAQTGTGCQRPLPGPSVQAGGLQVARLVLAGYLAAAGQA